MKDRLEQDLAVALAALQSTGMVPSDVNPSIVVTRTRDAGHGDFASNLAMMLAKPTGHAPCDIARALIEALPVSDDIRDVVVADPGFINFFQADEAQAAVVPAVLSQGRQFGRSQLGAGQRVQVECVSSCPAGPLPVSQGRPVALGATIADLMEAVGFEVRRVYRLTDAGCQMDGPAATAIRQELNEFGVHHAEWVSECSLGDALQRVVDRLEASGQLYEKEGVRWFRSSEFGDDRDRALLWGNGQGSCFASDIACIDNTLERGVDKVLYVFGADQHERAACLSAACQALGHPREKFEILLTRFANLFRGGEPVSLSTACDSIVTLRELCDEVGKDAARFLYVMRKHSQPFDFDLDLARSQSNENPAYHVQMAHARVCSVMRQLNQRALTFDQEAGLAALFRLSETAEFELMSLLAMFPERVQRAALAREPHQLTRYLRDLANGLHSYYNAHKVLVDDDELRHARVCLLLAVRQVLGNGLSLIGVSTPEVM
ncbi:arginine--tRNA ligase [Granulosicoccus sp. 3-233]|uniref:arginine--tRNA ligase n=1 Tax=Granulosicoccus sp. 3-233 TaxID=3417969 RepID=UPI003D34678B